MNYSNNIVKKINGIIHEGTWAVPDTPEKRLEVKAIIDDLKAKGFAIVNIEKLQRKIHDLIGDDELFDALDEFKEEAKAVRVAKVLETHAKRIVSAMHDEELESLDQAY